MTMAKTDPSTLAAAFMAQAHSTALSEAPFSGGKFRRGKGRKRAQPGREWHSHDESQRDQKNAADQQAISKVHANQRSQTAGQKKNVGEKGHNNEQQRNPAQSSARQPEPRKQAARAAGEHQQENHNR